MKKVLIIGLILCFLSVSGCGGDYADAVTLNACISEEPLTIQLDNGEIGNVSIPIKISSLFGKRCQVFPENLTGKSGNRSA